MRIRPILLIGAGLALTASGMGYASAQGSFFDRGREALESLGSSPAGSKLAPAASALGNEEITDGLREALRVGTGRVVDLLGAPDGFNGSSDVHISLPGTLQSAQQTLTKLGMGSIGEDLELRLNRSAEAAIPQTKALFLNAIQDMTLDDVQAIYSGPDNAATEYFRSKMSEPLAAGMRPIVDQELANVGAIKAYDAMIGQYKTIPFVPDAKADLTQYVLGKAVDGIFLYLAREEAAIRANPAKRTTELLQKVFGGN